MEPVRVSANSETIAKVRTKIIMAAPVVVDKIGKPTAKHLLVFSIA
jgi:hypothetical protein